MFLRLWVAHVFRRKARGAQNANTRFRTAYSGVLPERGDSARAAPSATMGAPDLEIIFDDLLERKSPQIGKLC